MQERIIIVDCGSQYTQLIARRVRELNIYCEIYPYNKEIKTDSTLKGVIISGSPHSVNNENAPQLKLEAYRKKFPLLGICYGSQYLVKYNGGEVVKSATREFGRANLSFVDTESTLLESIPHNTQVWMSHSDTISKLPTGFKVIASTNDIRNAAYQIEGENTFGLQFHPEVYHTTNGKKIIENFLVGICKCSQNWTPLSFVKTSVADIKNTVKEDNVILGLSGGVDSTVAAVLIHKAIGKQLTCIFVDNGLLRKNEYETVYQKYQELGLNVIAVDAKNKFLMPLKGVSDPEKKRKIIGKVFIDVFNEEAQKIKNAKWLAQGTIYPDVIESVSVNGPSATIKSHHNVGGLPEKMHLKILEPLNLLFKDEVRRIGDSLGIDDKFLKRHPFPGPGLAIRIIGEITEEKTAVLQEADYIFINKLKEKKLYDQVWQAATILLPIQSVGVMGDERTYENVVVLRAVASTDGMTADWVHLPYQFLAEISNEIINKVKGINRVVYDISSKPPATIEWE